MQRETQGTMTDDQRPYDRVMDEDPEAEAPGMLSSTVSKVQGKVSDGAEAGKGQVAAGIESAADMVREKLPSDGMVGQVGTKTADTLEKSAGYLRDHETTELWGDVQEYVRQHPASALVGALAAGYVLSRILR